MPIDSSEGTFLFIHRALEAINLFPLTQGHLDRAGAPDLPNTLLHTLV